MLGVHRREFRGFAEAEKTRGKESSRNVRGEWVFVGEERSETAGKSVFLDFCN